MSTAPDRSLIVTIDTEVDKDSQWRISPNGSFASVVDGIPNTFQPIFDSVGASPTYLLSPEVIENEPSKAVLREISRRVELGTHLHCDFLAPNRRLTPQDMPGRLASTPQSSLPSATERLKLIELTQMFFESFDKRPTSFRAGRFALSPDTLTHLAELGYTIDSSVTPGLIWRFEGHQIDYRSWSTAPRWIDTSAGKILELPVAVRRGSRIAPYLHDGAAIHKRAVRRLLGNRARMVWLRPSFFSGAAMIDYVRRTTDRFLVVMLHSNEIIPGASPYAQSRRAVLQITDGLKLLCEHCQAAGIGFRTLSEVPSLVR